MKVTILGIETPVASGLINIAGACLQRDFRQIGRTIDRLGKDKLKEIFLDK